MERFFGVEDVEGFLARRKSIKMDPEEYLRHESDIQTEFIQRMSELKHIQQQRAKRFKLLYKELDEFDPQQVYYEIRRMRKTKYIVNFLLKKTEKFRRIYVYGDSEWIVHKNYNEYFLDEDIGDEIKNDYLTLREVLGKFKREFKLECDDSSSDSD